MSEVGQAIREYANSLTERTKELFQQLTEIGAVQVADVDGYTRGGEIKVYTTFDEHGGELVAWGKGVCFLEFGAGLTTNPSHPYASQMSGAFTVASGSYSSTEGSGEFAQNGVWNFGGRTYDHIPSRMGMYHAAQLMKQSIASVVKEVYSSDRH